MNIISYTKDVPAIRIVFAGLALLSGIYGVINGRPSSLIILCLGAYFLSTEGSEINLTNKTYRTIRSLFGIKIGKWQHIPEFEYVSVFRTSETQRVNGMAATAEVKDAVILLNVFYNSNKHITFYKTKDKADAFQVAGHIALALGIDILDATERDKKWL